MRSQTPWAVFEDVQNIKSNQIKEFSRHFRKCMSVIIQMDERFTNAIIKTE